MPGLDIHAGISMALHACGIKCTESSGTSAGAIYCAMEASDRSPMNIAAILRNLTDEDVRHERPFWKLRFPWLDSVMESDRVAALIRKYIYIDWQFLTHPITVWATSETSGAIKPFAGPADGPLQSAVRASMSIAGLFPAVSIGGTPYIDGGVRRNLPLPMNWRVFDEVWLLIASQRLQPTRHTGILSRAMRNFEISLYDQVADVVEEIGATPNVRVIWPDFAGATGGLLHFNHDLISLAYNSTRTMLREIYNINASNDCDLAGG
jgi:predicted acylesterase/phospholipase RssA